MALSCAVGDKYKKMLQYAAKVTADMHLVRTS